MKKEQAKSDLCLVLVAFIWGIAFVFQKTGERIGTLSFVFGRMFLGAISLLVVALFLNRPRAGESWQQAWEHAWTHDALRGGIWCGTFLFIAASLQQLGLETVSAGESGFLTAPYTVLVPIFSVMAGRRVRPIIWVSAILCLTGVGFLCLTGTSGISGFGPGHAVTLLGAVFWALQILAISRFVETVDSVVLSFAQTAVAAVLAFVCMMIFESPTLASFVSALPSLLYVGIASTGVAFGLQVYGQARTTPTQATILMSLESVFSVLAGVVLLGERMQLSQYVGCLLIFAATVLSQLPERDVQKQTAG